MSLSPALASRTCCLPTLTLPDNRLDPPDPPGLTRLLPPTLSRPTTASWAPWAAADRCPRTTTRTTLCRPWRG